MIAEYSDADDDIVRWQSADGTVKTAHIDDLISAYEPKHGKWLKIEDCNTVQCSECFYDFDYVDGLCYLCHGQELPNYCPNCGAIMERKEE